jgi:replication fork protection complex subunit Tof1/Swi1
LFKNARLKLLMTLVGFERLGVEDALDTTWIVPSALTSSELGETLLVVEKFEQSPWASDDPNESPEDLLRRARHTARDQEDDVQRDAFIDDSEGDDGLEDFMFPDNIRSKSLASRAIEELKEARRKRKNKSEREPLDDEIAEARRKAKQAAALERRRKIKSELYIHDSDEDMNEEESKEFFAREEESRKRQTERVRRALAFGIPDSGGKSKKRKSTGGSHAPEKRRREDDSADDELPSDEDDGLTDSDSDSSSQRVDTSDEMMEDTPLSSQSHDAVEETTPKEAVLKELQQPPAEARPASKVNPESADEEDDEVRVASSRRARYRAGFIVDSDDE